jgi:hypothetical protein
MKRRIHISEETLRALYPKSSVDEIADDLQCSTAVIYDRLHELGIPLIVHQNRAFQLQKEELTTRLNAGETVSEEAIACLGIEFPTRYPRRPEVDREAFHSR